jgi:hypothetical protein
MAAQDFGPTVLGRPIEILHADTQNKPDIASAQARQWYDSGVDAITDLPVTPVAAAVLQVAREKSRTVMITAAAVTEFTSKLCAPISTHWADDTHALTHATAAEVVKQGGKSWFFTRSRRATSSTTCPSPSPTSRTSPASTKRIHSMWSVIKYIFSTTYSNRTNRHIRHKIVRLGPKLFSST